MIVKAISQLDYFCFTEQTNAELPKSKSIEIQTPE